MTTVMPRSARAEREWLRYPAVVVVAYVSLAILVGLTVANKRSAGDSLLIDLILVGLLALWILWFVVLSPARRDSQPLMAVFFVGLVAVLAVLVVRDPWFGGFAPAGYVFAFKLIRWPRLLLAVAAIAVIAGIAQASGIGWSSLDAWLASGAVLLVNIVPMCGFAWFLRFAETRSQARDEALDALSEANRKLEATVAENAALHERLIAQAREAGEQSERQRMAREIHDILAQGLIGIITQLQAAEQAGEDAEERHRHFAAATSLARESLSDARRSVHALRPQQLQEAGLADALGGLARRWSALHRVPVAVTTTGTERPLRQDAEFALLRTAQEALANVARHAAATRVGLTLSFMDNEVVLDVRDDGRGFDPDRPREIDDGRGGGFGLVAMCQRIEGLSGTVQIESEPDAGTAISACVPADPVEAR